MSERELQRQLEKVTNRQRKESFLRTLIQLWVSLSVLLGLLLYSEFGWIAAGVISLMTFVMFRTLTSMKTSKQESIAKSIEQKFPDLKTNLITAIEQKPNSSSGKLSYLQKRVIDNAVWHSAINDWKQTIPSKRLALLGLGQFGLLSLVAFLFFTWVNHQPLAASVDSHEPTSHSVFRVPIGTVVEVDPGDLSLERGRDLLVLAKFHGEIPHDVSLVFNAENNQSRTIILDKQLDDPIFGGRLNHIESNGTYHIEYDGQQSQIFRVTVFDYPDLEQADATITYPSFTKLVVDTLEDVRQLTIVEGSSVLLECRLNKQVKEVKLVTENGLEIELQQSPKNSSDFFQYRLQPKKSMVYRLHLTDNEGRQNREPIEIVCDVTPNRKPVIKWTFPTRDIKASPLEEISLNALVWDDFGIVEYGLKFGIAGEPIQTLNLSENEQSSKTTGIKEVTISHLLALETLSVKPDQLISYYFYADDFGSDGKQRRTYSDMFFAEVRHFEEIFRQGRQPPKGGSPKQNKKSNGNNKTAQLIKLQKQIINATWNLIRDDEKDDKFLQDVELVKESQQNAIELLNKKKHKLKTQQLKQFAELAEQEMQQAVVELEKVNNEFADPLQDALGHEQAAYQALLKLRAKEHRIAKGQQSSSQGGSSSNRSQQQLQQLELSNKKNRYQTKNNQNANSSQNQKREDFQTLNRLKELAQRQGDLNKKLKDLERALRKAKTEVEKEENRRELKRLREEQQKLLRDLDKMKNRLDKNQPQNMEQTKRKLEETRKQVRRSSEALKNQQVSKAISSASKAERYLKQIRQEFRQRSSVRFAEDMKNLKQQAKELAERQNEIDKKLQDNQSHNQRPSLKDSVDSQQVAKDLRDQKKKVNHILEEMKKVVQDSENSEPLLSNRLYDSIRKSRKNQSQEKLEQAAKSLDRDDRKQAQLTEKEAKKGIDMLRKQIDKAAESILGNELESLKQAKKEIDKLSEELKKELQQNQPKQLERKQLAQASKPGESSSQRKSKTGNASPGRKSPSGNRSSKKSKTKSNRNSSGGKDGSARHNKASQTRKKPSFLSGGGGGSGKGPGGPITGRDFQDWSQRMQDVENMLDRQPLRSKVAEVRERTRKMRADFKRHTKEPNWSLVRRDLLQPLVEIQKILAEEIAKQQSKDALVPQDRDPVPPQYSETVRRYYEELGKGK